MLTKKQIMDSLIAKESLHRLRVRTFRKPEPKMIVDDWPLLRDSISELASQLHGYNFTMDLYMDDTHFWYLDECETLAIQTFFELGW